MVGKSMTLTLATLALPAFVSAAGRVPAPRGPRVPAPIQRAECLAVQLTSPQGPAVRGAFSAQRHYDVDFAVRLAPRAATPGRVVQLKLYTPRGFLYQTLETAVPQAQPRPRQRRPATPKDTTLAARLPVAGTWITQNTLYGSWKVVPHFEGQTAACGRAATFQITR